MRKLLSLLLILSITLSLSGCSWLEGIFYPPSDPLDFGRGESYSNITTDSFEALYDRENNKIQEPQISDIETRAQSIKAQNLTTSRIKDSVLYTGNLVRLAKVLNKAEAVFVEPEQEPVFFEEDTPISHSSSSTGYDKSPITVGFIGSGAMAGEGVEYMKDAYPFAIRRWFADNYGSDNFKFIFAGTSHADSMYGAHAVTYDLLNSKPNIVFVDYSVLDMKNENSRETFESLIRNLVFSDSAPAVIILSTMDSTCQSNYAEELEVARAYGLPMISMPHAVSSEISTGAFSFATLSDNGFDLGLTGHALFGELCANFLENVRRQLNKINTDTEPTLPAIPMTSCRFINSALLNNLSRPTKIGSFIKTFLKYDIFNHNSWECTKADGDPILFNLQTQYISICYWRVTDRTGGKLDVYIDGVLTKTLDCDYKDGPEDYAATELVYVGDSLAIHKVEIKMSPNKNNGSTGERVCLIGVLIASEEKPA